jgi:hypothetical protein
LRQKTIRNHAAEKFWLRRAYFDHQVLTSTPRSGGSLKLLS